MANTPVPQPVQDLTREYAGREYCSFGFQYHISCVPVDEVRTQLPVLTFI